MNDLIYNNERIQLNDILSHYMEGDNSIKPQSIDTVVCSMVYGFAKHLPYSMDIEQEEYVPADFFNITPEYAQYSKLFKWDDSKTIYFAMKSWGDTYKSGMLLQMCAVFQKMLLGKYTSEYELSEEDYTALEINTMTGDEEYNRHFFEIFKELPKYYNTVNSKSNREDRRQALEDVYGEIMNKISQRLGGFKQSDIEESVLRETKPNIMLSSCKDLEMLLCNRNISFSDGINLPLTKQIKEMQLEEYNIRKEAESGYLVPGVSKIAGR